MALIDLLTEGNSNLLLGFGVLFIQVKRWIAQSLLVQYLPVSVNEAQITTLTIEMKLQTKPSCYLPKDKQVYISYT